MVSSCKHNIVGTLTKSELATIVGSRLLCGALY